MGNCCDKVEVAGDSPSPTRPLLQNERLKANSIYIPASSNYDHENSVKSNSSCNRISAEQAFLNDILENIAGQVIDIASTDMTSNHYDYLGQLERAQMYEAKLPEVIVEDSVTPRFASQQSAFQSLHVDNPERVRMVLKTLWRVFG